MARVSVYLNFMGNTEEAFNFYKSVFGTEFLSPIQRMRDVPPDPSMPPLSEAEGNMVMHVELPILAGMVLMGTDMLKSMGHELVPGNTMSINVEPETRTETVKLFGRLLEDGSNVLPLADMFWGGLFGSGVDKYGVRWMFNCDEPKAEV